MRDIADKFVGGIERIDAGLPPQRSGLTGRAVLIGLGAVAALALLEPINQAVFENTMLIGNQLPVGVVFLVCFLVLVVNPLLSLLARRGSKRTGPLSPAELVVIATAMMSACAVIWSGFHRLWAHLLVAPFYYLQSNPRWAPLVNSLPWWLVPATGPQKSEIAYSILAYLKSDPRLVHLLPLVRWLLSWLVPTAGPQEGEIAYPILAYLESDPRLAYLVPVARWLLSWLVPSTHPGNREIVDAFFVGGSTVPWGPWCLTALLWAPFVLAFFVGCFFMVALFRRQWQEAERLSFPLATIAMEMLRPPPPGRLLNDLFRSRLFWWSFAIVVGFQMLHGLHICFPAFPEVIFKYDLNSAFETPPWRYLPPWIKAKDAFFIAIGVAFFLSTEMSFSLWATVIILAVVEMLGKTYQYPIHERFNDHQVGAYLAYTLVILWVGRGHLRRVLRSIWRRPDRNADDDHVSERTAAIGFLVCFAVAAAWLKMAGLSLGLAVLVTAIVFMLALVVGRVVAESGLLFVQYGCFPARIAESCFGSLLTPSSHALIQFTTAAPTLDARDSPAPFAFNSARMADGVQHLRRRRLFIVWIAALVLGLLVAGATQLSIVYRRGALLTDEFAGRFAPQILYNSSADFADFLQQSPEKISEETRRHFQDVATGGGIVLALCFLRYRFLAWPLHPIGFIVAGSYPMRVFWLSIMIGWLCKTLVMRLGGVPVYRKLAPIFMAMIVGTAFSSVFWIVVKIAMYAAGEEGRIIWFLPN